MEYVVLPYGIYIQGVSGQLYATSEWNSQEIVNGVAVLTEKASFVIALAAFDEWKIWNDSADRLDGLAETSDLASAQADYNGRENTNIIISQTAGEDNAAKSCNDFIFPNGQNGYLGAAGEWQIVADNLSSINAAMIACGGDKMEDAVESIVTYWSSTQCDDSSAWMLFGYPAETSALQADTKRYTTYARPFTEI